MDEPDTSDLDALVARVDPDRWLSSRFVSDPLTRADLIVLYAFDYELARAPKVVTNPLMGEIRLTWWGEVLDEIFSGAAVRHHPTAQALAGLVHRRRLSRESLDAMVEARMRELDPAPMSLAELEVWARGSGGAAAVAAAQILDPDGRPESARSAGTAWALGHRLRGEESEKIMSEAMRAARDDVRDLGVTAFPAVAHAVLAPPRAKGGTLSPFGARWRLILAVALGRL